MKAGAKAAWTRAILVCGKCERKLGGGFGMEGEDRLSKLLARRNAGGKGRKAAIGVVRVPCLKLCPKGAVTVVDAARPRDWLIVARGTPIAEVEGRLGLGGPLSPPPNLQPQPVRPE